MENLLVNTLKLENVEIHEFRLGNVDIPNPLLFHAAFFFEAEAPEQLAERAADLTKESKWSYVHGDFHGGNILVDGLPLNVPFVFSCPDSIS